MAEEKKKATHKKIQSIEEPLKIKGFFSDVIDINMKPNQEMKDGERESKY
jgi:hypothetical protein